MPRSLAASAGDPEDIRDSERRGAEKLYHVRDTNMSKRGAAWEEEAAAAAKAARTDAGEATHSVAEEALASQPAKEPDTPVVEASSAEEKVHGSHAEEARADSAPAASQPTAPAASSDAPVQEKKEGSDAQTTNDGQGRQAVCKASLCSHRNARWPFSLGTVALDTRVCRCMLHAKLTQQPWCKDDRGRHL